MEARIAGGAGLRLLPTFNKRSWWLDDDMSDAPSGPGWWQASDGKWYPPEQASGAAQPADATGTGYGVPYGGAPRDADIGSALSYGWNKFIANIGDIIVIWLIIFAVQIIFNIISRSTSSLVLSLVLMLVGFLISMILQIALVRIGLILTSGQKVTPAAAFSTELRRRSWTSRSAPCCRRR